MGNVIRLRSWLSKHIEKEEIQTPTPKLNKLCLHYQRMRLFEAELKRCPTINQ